MAQTTLTFDDPGKVVDGAAGGSSGDSSLQYGDYVFTITAQGNWSASFDNGRFNFKEDASAGAEDFKIAVTSASGASFDFYDYQISVDATPIAVGGWPSTVSVGNTNWSDDNIHGDGVGPYYYRTIFNPADLPPVTRAGSFNIKDSDIIGTTESGTISVWLDNITIDYALPPPQVTTVSSTAANGTYKTGEVISITVTFNQVVMVNGTPQLKLETGSTDHVLNLASGSGTNTLTFNYTVQAGDSSTDLDFFSNSAFTLNGGTIVNIDGTNAILTLPTPGTPNSLGGQKDIVIDGIAPSVESITRNDGTPSAADVVNFTVRFSENVTGVSMDDFILTVTGTIGGSITSISGSGNTYTITVGDLIGDGTIRLDLKGATDITDQAGNGIPGFSQGDAYTIDNTAPAVASVQAPGEGTYSQAAHLDFIVNFGEAVTVDTTGGSPRIAITLDTGGFVYATYVSGSGTGALTFRYTVANGDADMNGVTIGALTLNGGTIKDSVGNDASVILTSVGDTSGVIIDAGDYAPVLTVSPGTVSFTENDAATPIDANLTLTDADDTHFASATVSVSANFQSGEDVLAFANTNSAVYGNIDAVYVGDTLTLSSAGGTATLAQWQAALRAVTYANTSSAPDPSDRTISFVINDGGLDSAPVTKAISVTSVNDVPIVVTSGGPTLFTEGENTASTPVAIDTGLTVSDADNATLVSATVSITGNLARDEDLLNFNNTSSATYGNITASYSASTGQLILTSSDGSATLAQWQSALRAVTYSNTSEVPSTAPRTLSFSVNDGTVDSLVATKSVTVAAVNDAPTFVGLDGTPVYTLTNPSVALDASAMLLDPDLDYAASQNGSFAGSTLTIQRNGGPNAEDIFTVAGGVYINGGELCNLEGDTIATVTRNSGGVLQVSFTGPSPILVTSSLVNSFLQSIHYSNSGAMAGNVQIDYTFSDGNTGAQGPGGAKSVTGSIDVTVLLPNQPPVLTGDLAATVNEGATYALTAADLGFTDPDNTSADVRFTVTVQKNGTVLVNGVVATHFTGAELAAGKVSFRHDGTETTAASFKVSVEDGNEDATIPTISTFNFTVTPVNDAPKLTGDLKATVKEGATYTLTAADLGFTDPDDGASGVTFTVTVQKNGTVLVNGVAATHFTSAELAAGKVNFRHDGTETTAASFKVSVEDGNEDATIPTISTFNFTVTPVNDAPKLTGDLKATVKEGATYTLTAADLGFTDPDDGANGVTFTVTVQKNGTVLVNGVAATYFTSAELAAGKVNFRHDGTDTSYASFKVLVEDGNEDGSVPTASTFNVTVTPVNDAPKLTGDLKATVKEGATYTLTAADLGFTDPDDGASGVTFNVSSLAAGKIYVSGKVASSFTAKQLADGLVTFRHDGSETAKASFKVLVEDGNEDGSVPTASTFSFTVTPVNDAPKIAATQVLSSIAENASTASSLKVAELSLIDPDGGNNVLSLVGADAKLFEIKNGAIWLKAGAKLDFETNSSLDVTVRVDDPTIGKSYEASKSFTISVTDVKETPPGTEGSEKLVGGNGDDVLDGKGGNDVIEGGGGNDTLIGGTGIDTLTGGAGRDIFVFATPQDSAPGYSGYVNNGAYDPLSGAAKRDVVTDFVKGEDRLDLSKIDASLKLSGDQAFIWNGTANFSSKSGDLIYRTFDLAGTANDKTIVYGDIDLDGRADFQIELAGILNLSRSDFIL
jgi:hypothetical protein